MLSMLPIGLFLIAAASSKSSTVAYPLHLSDNEEAKSLIRVKHASDNEVITIDECLYTWNISSQRFNGYVAWTGDPPSNSYSVSVTYNGLFAVFNEQVGGNTSFNFSVTPTIDNESAIVQVQSFNVETCPLNLTIPSPDPIESIQTLNYTITSSTDTPPNTLLAVVRDLSLNWSVPVSPTGNVHDLVYEIRLSGNESIPESATVLSVTDIITSMDQLTQKGSVSMTNSLHVPETFTMLYFQIRSFYNISLNNGMMYTLVSDWSSSQPILRFPINIISSSSTTVSTLLVSSTTITRSSLSPPQTHTTMPSPLSSSLLSLSTTSTSSPSVIKSTTTTSSKSIISSKSTITSFSNSPAVNIVTPSPSIVTASTATASPNSLNSASSTSTANNTIPKTVKPPNNSTVYIAVGVAVGVTILVIVVIVVFCVSFITIRNKRRKAVPVHTEDMTLGNIAVVNSDKWEIPHDCVQYQEGIGSGAFGEVYRAVIKGHSSNILDMYLRKNNHNYSVAVKKLKSNATELDEEQFLKEIELMKRISSNSNPHVVNMVGASTTNPPLLLILEYVQHGDLLSYLKACRHESLRDSSVPLAAGLDPLQASDIPSFAYQIASGMQYLSSMDLVHRDLACRNILIGEGRKLKITDFGLSRELNLETMYVAQPGGRFPVRWMAIESIMDRKFNTSSDVWSFGVTLWEIGSLGETPYATVGNDDLLRHIKDGHRLQRPIDYINEEIYSLMRKCWSVRQSDRPSFSRLRNAFDVMLSRNRSDSQFYMDLSPPRLDSIAAGNSLSRPNTYVKVS